MTISATKIHVVTSLMDSSMAAYWTSMGYRSIDNVTVLTVMDSRIKMMKY